eukprot:1308044-Pyramimonas_sp.AAC.1
MEQEFLLVYVGRRGCEGALLDDDDVCGPCEPELEVVDFVSVLLADGTSREISCLTPDASATGGVAGVAGYMPRPAGAREKDLKPRSLVR